MAHFANIENGIVTKVIVIHNDDAANEKNGQDFIANTLNLSGLWLQTSYNTLGNKHLLNGIPFRKNYAGIGFSYDAQRDAFIPPKPTKGEWILNEETCLWEEIL